jgi:hypothetical protein
MDLENDSRQTHALPFSTGKLAGVPGQFIF